MSVSKWQWRVGTLLVVLVVASAVAQQRPAASLVNGPVDDSVLTVLRGNRYPLAVAKYDQGPAPDSLPLERMLLVLKRTAAQESALRKLLDDQQDSASPNYHKWLTPEDFGTRFGASDADVAAVTGWLQAHGFGPATLSKGRTVIAFQEPRARSRRRSTPRFINTL